MIKYILIFLISLNLFGFEFIEILNPNVVVHKSGYFKTDKELTPQEAYEFIKQNGVKSVPKDAISFGFDSNTYWFIFEISTLGDEKLFLDSKSVVGDYQNLYVFENDKLIRTQKNGYLTKIKDREIKTFPIRFELESNKKLTYLFSISTHSPHYVSFAFGEDLNVRKDWNIILFIMIFSISTSISFIIYNMFLYFMTKDKSYLFYSIYIIGFLGLNFIGLGYVSLVPFLSTQDAFYYFTIAVLTKITGLTFFAIYFLRLNEREKKLKNIFITLLIITLLLSILYVTRIAQPIFALFIQAIMIFSIYVGVKSYINGFKPAIYYLFATGFGNMLFVGFMLMNQGNGVKYSIFTMNLSNFAMIWDLLMFSFALAYRIRVLQQENKEKERMLMLKSRQKCMGELSGNIAHQWREPLAELGSITSNLEAKLIYSTIEKDEMLKSIQLSKNILKHLSQTVTTFQRFFQNRVAEDAMFDIDSEIKNSIAFVKESLNHNNIEIIYYSNSDKSLKGDGNLFSQALLSIILNAKDILIARNITNAKIEIVLIIDKENVVVKISDNGGRIKIEPIDKIFEYFITDKPNGSGLGLFITKNIIENSLNGNIIAYNSKDGAVFEIEFNSTS